MAPLRLIKVAGRMMGQGQKLANRGQPEFAKAGEELATTTSGASKLIHWANKLDVGVDLLEVHLLERFERYAWLSCRTGLALGAFVGSGYGMKYTFQELWSPRPFGHLLSSGSSDADSYYNNTVEKPVMSYKEVKALALELNGKYLKKLIDGLQEAFDVGLLDTFGHDIVLQHQKVLESTPLTFDQRHEVHMSFLNAAVKEMKKFNLLVNKSRVDSSDGDVSTQN